MTESTRVFVLMNHPLRPEQVADVATAWGCEPTPAPVDVRTFWGAVDPAAEEAHTTAAVTAAETWLSAARAGDVVVVAGEPTAVFAVASAMKARGVIPVAATTRRVSEEVVQEDGSVKKVSSFRHVRFRKF